MITYIESFQKKLKLFNWKYFNSVEEFLLTWSVMKRYLNIYNLELPGSMNDLKKLKRRVLLETLVCLASLNNFFSSFNNDSPHEYLWTNYLCKSRRKFIVENQILVRIYESDPLEYGTRSWFLNFMIKTSLIPTKSIAIVDRITIHSSHYRHILFEERCFSSLSISWKEYMNKVCFYMTIYQLCFTVLPHLKLPPNNAIIWFHINYMWHWLKHSFGRAFLLYLRVLWLSINRLNLIKLFCIDNLFFIFAAFFFTLSFIYWLEIMVSVRLQVCKFLNVR